MRTRILTAAAVALAGTFTIAANVPAITASAWVPDLIISEYIEPNSGTCKAIELYNESGVAIDLGAGGYQLSRFTNGGAIGTSIALTGTVASGDVFVVSGCSDTAAAGNYVYDLFDTNVNHNGDDGYTLTKNAVTIDSFGQSGVDPGTAWTGGAVSTVDSTLRRKPTVCVGDADFSNTFDPSIEWDSVGVNDWSGLGAHSTTCGPPPPVVPMINEFVADTSVLGGSEFVEILGGLSADTSAYTLLQIDGAGGVTGSYPLTATNASGYELPDISGAPLANAGMTLLLVEGLVGSPTDVDNDDDGTLNSPAPWTTLVDSVAVGSAGQEYSTTVLANTVDGAARIPNGTDTDAAADWVAHGTAVGAATITSGTSNAVVPPCPDAVDKISTIQGSGAASPCVGQPVVIEGIVVGDYEGTSAAGTLRGFYVQSQTADQDADPATSEGIFVFNFDNNNVNVGDAVHVEGTVAENQGQTQLGFPSVLNVLSTGNSLAATAATLPIDLERYEGMLVTFPQELTVTETFQLGRFSQVTVSQGGRLDQPTAVVEPGAASVALQDANNLRKLVIDDATQLQNLDPIVWGRGGMPLSASNTLRGGDTTTGATGVLTYTWGGVSASPNAFRLRPPSPLANPNATATFVAANPRPTGPPAVGGSLQISGFNVLNYFVTLDVGTQQNCGPTGNKQECRGAETAEEYTRQHDKLIAALLKVDADVFGFAELENTTGVDPLAPIVASLNTALGANVWAAVNTGIIGTDTIRVGVIYRQDRLEQLGVPAVLDDTVDPTFDDDNNRPTLAVTFAEIATGEALTVVVNHWKSKGSCPAAGTPDSDAFDGAGCWNAVRTAAATAVVNWLGDYPTGVVDDDVLVFGDLNSYAQEDPIDVLRDAGYVDLVQVFHPGAYSYVFDGQWGTLDYAFGSSSLAAQTTGADDYHINADEPPILDYNTNFKTPAQIISLYAPDEFRTSDHDPALVGLALDSDSPLVTLEQAGDSDPTNGSVTFDITFSEAVTGFVASDVTLTGPVPGSVQLIEIVPGLEYQLILEDFGADGEVTAAIAAGVVTDGTGNANLASVSNDNSVTVDLTVPTVTINQGASQVDPAVAGPVVFTVVFSEPVTGFTAADVVVGGTAGATTVNVTGSGTTYTVTVSGTTTEGTVTATVAAGAASDSAGNASLASTSTDNTVTVAMPVNLADATRFVPLNPFRLFDTRVTEPGNGPKGLVGADSAIDVQIVGVGGVPANAVAVVMNLTVTDTAGPSFVSAYPKGEPRPIVSALNIIEAGQTRANLVTVPIGDNGMVTLYTLAAANLLADVAGYYVPNSEAVRAGRFIPLTPQRAFDTRPTELGAPGPKGKMEADQIIDVQILGFGDVPTTGVSAVVINITGTEASAPGFLTAYPNGMGIPFASNVNLATVGTTAPNLAIVPIGADGKISIYSSGGTHALGDVTGYITDATADVSISGLFVPVVPERTYDGRTSQGGPGFVPAEGTAVVPVGGVKSIPANAGAVVLNVAGVNSPLGFLTAWNTGVDRPTASTVNFVFQPLDTRANAAMLPLGEGGNISFYTLNGSDIVVDTSGYFLK